MYYLKFQSAITFNGIEFLDEMTDLFKSFQPRDTYWDDISDENFTLFYQYRWCVGVFVSLKIQTFLNRV